MPEGLAVLKWDDELGPVVTAKTPRNLQTGLDPTTTMRVYGIMTLGETEEAQRPDFKALPFDKFNLAVYYGGLNMHLKGLPSMVFLVLSPEEDPEVYKDALPEIATQIFMNADGNQYKKMIPTFFKQLERYTHMTAEQRQAAILNDPVRRAILQTLTKNGTIESADLEQLIFEEVGKKIDVDMVLRPLVKMGIIATGWVEGLASEVVYLTRALFILRTISRETAKAVRGNQLPQEINSQFIEMAKKYHKDYIARLRRDLFEAIWSEAEALSKHLLDFEAYDLIKILREGPQQTEHLPSLLDMPKSDLRKIVRRLEKANIVVSLNDDEGREHLLLKADPQVVTVYPEWLIQRTVELYNNEEIPSRQAIHYLEILKRWHPSRFATAMAEVE